MATKTKETRHEYKGKLIRKTDSGRWDVLGMPARFYAHGEGFGTVTFKTLSAAKDFIDRNENER